MLAYQDFKHERGNNFDVIRLVLAVLVVMSHGNYFYGLGVEHVLWNQAGLAVDGFFIVSGFLITWSIDRTFDTKQYVIKRFARIYPLYFIVITVQLVLLFWLSDGPDVSEAVSYYGWNLLFLNFLQPEFGEVVSEPINGSLWTLKVEVMFYIILPIFLWLYRRLGVWFLVVGYLCAVGYKYGVTEMGYPRYAKQLPGAMSLFIIGTALYFYGKSIFRKQQILLKMAAMAALAVAAYIHSVGVLITYQIVLGLVLYTVVFYTPKITLRCDMSYGLYVWHVPVFLLLPILGMTSPMLGVIAVLLLGYVSARWVEEPMIRWGGQQVKKMKRETN